MQRDGSDVPIWVLNGLLLTGAALSASSERVEARAGELAPAPRTARVDPDALSARELRALPGIGPTRALAIVRTRWEGLRGGPAAWISISGIGEATVGAAADALALPALEPPSERAYTRRDIP